MEYKLVRKKIKNIYARLDENNNLVISAPIFTPLRVIDKFAQEAYQKLSKRREKKVKPVVFNDHGEVRIFGKYQEIESVSELNALLLRKLKEYLNNNYMRIISMMGIENIPVVRIKKVKNYLGQYNKKNNTINLNLLLAHLEEPLIEYVLIHELAHTRYLNHQREFWDEVSKYCPYYKTYRNKCKKEFVYYENY